MAYSIDSKNGLIFENRQFNSWLMSKMLFDFRLSCTIFHVTFVNSDHFFRTLVVKILIFIRKKSAHLEFQLWFFVKFWLSPGKKKKKEKSFEAEGRFEPGSTGREPDMLTIRPQETWYNSNDFTKIYIKTILYLKNFFASCKILFTFST